MKETDMKTITYLEKRTVKLEDTLSMDEMAEIAVQDTIRSNRDYDVRKALRANR